MELSKVKPSQAIPQGTGAAGPQKPYAQQPDTPSQQPAPKAMSLKRELSGLFCLITALLLFCAAAAPILTPKRHDYGAIWGMYSQEPENSVDALFFGSSLTYCDVVPSVLYEESGAASFVMAGPEQTFPITYRYLREACKTQSPQIVFIEATGLIYGKSNRSVKVNLTYMPWSMERLIPTLEEDLTEGGKTPEETAQMEKEALTGLLFPLYSYHDRWDKLTRRDYKEGLLGYEPDLLAGYTFLDQVTPIKGISEREVTDDPENYARNLKYAEKMTAFCKEQNILPVFFLSPSTQRLSDELQKQISGDVKRLGAQFIDFNESFDKMDFDLNTDFFDLQHLNCRGAEKFSRYLAGVLNELDIAPSGKEDKALWQKRAEHFAALRKDADSSQQGE